jgi:hypothetical protein
LWAVVEEELVGLQELAEGKPVVHLGQSGPVLTLGEAEEVPNDHEMVEAGPDGQ